MEQLLARRVKSNEVFFKFDKRNNGTWSKDRNDELEEETEDTRKDRQLNEQGLWADEDREFSAQGEATLRGSSKLTRGRNRQSPWVQLMEMTDS